MGEDPRRDTRRRLGVSEAADVLGVTVDAVRSRIKRGTIAYVREGGRVYVLLGADESRPGPDQPTDQGGDQGTGQAEDRTAELIATLREQLQAERQAHAEARRLLAAALERIPAIEAPQKASDAPETVEEAPDRTEPQSATEGAQGGTERPQQLSRWREPVDKLPWWHYVLGLLLVVLASFLLSPFLVVNWLPSGVFGLWVGFRRWNPRFWAQITPFGVLVGLAIAPGDVVTTLGWDFARTAKVDSAAHLAVFLAAYITPTVIAGCLFYVSGVLVGNAWQRRRTGRLSGTIPASPGPTTNWTPRQQAILGFVGTVIAALISLTGTIFSVILASGD